MLGLQFIRDNPDVVRQALARRDSNAPLDELLELDEKARKLRSAMESRRAEQKRLSQEKPTDEMRIQLTELKGQIQQEEAQVTTLDSEISELMLRIPNLPAETTPDGKSAEDNVVVRTEGKAPEFAFAPKTHDDLGEAMGLLDFDRGTKIAKARFAVLKGPLARMERALENYCLDMGEANGYLRIDPPFLVSRTSLFSSGHLPKFEEDLFKTDDDLFLNPTAEVALTNLYRDEILEAGQLPMKHVAYSPSWRREAGAAGKDTRGYIRLHQFDKVELYKYVRPETALDELETLLADAEKVVKSLGLHYRILALCAGDMGFSMEKTYDIEAWAPGLGRWLEISSCSSAATFQARRANLRFREGPQGKPQFIATLNGSGLAMPRTIDAILETYQNQDGSVTVPDVLRPYMGGLKEFGPGGSQL
jgi:seryl-tRNA synthetase